MSNSIAFLERKQTEAARKNFQKCVTDLGVKIYADWNELNGNIPQVLFYHGGDEIQLREENRSSKPFRKELGKVFFIEYGGDPTVQKQSVKNIVSYIKYSDLQNRLSEITKTISNLPKITLKEIEEIVFAIDPKLEELLKPFANVLPLDENWEGTDLLSAKDKLIIEVNKKLKQ